MKIKKEQLTSRNNNKNKKININNEKVNKSFENTKDLLTNRILINLIKTEEELKKKIFKCNSNGNLLKNKSYVKIFNKSSENLLSDKNFIKYKISLLEKNKNIYSCKSNFINSQINKLQYYQDKVSGDLKQRINDNLTKLNKNISYDTLLEKKIKKLKIEQNKRTILMQKDICNCYNNKIKQLIITKQVEEQKKSDLLKEKRNKEREDIIKRNQKNNESINNLRKFINEKPKENYIYKKMIKNYKDKEYNLIKNENLKRKEYMKPIDGQEFTNIEKNYQDFKEQQESELKEKKKILKLEWSKRRKLIPLYINSFTKKVNEEKEKIEQEKEFKLKRISDLKNNQIQYSNNVPIPTKIIKEKIHDNLTDRRNIISHKNKNFNPIFSNSINYSDIIRKQNINANKKRNNNEENKLFNKSEEKQPKKNIINNNNKKNNICDYLTERRNVNKEKNEKNKNAKDISIYLKKNGINEATVNMARDRIKNLDEKKRQKDLLLKYKGGIANNIELGDEICDILIDSMNARISLIKEIDKKLKDNNNIYKNENISEEENDRNYSNNNSINQEYN